MNTHNIISKFEKKKYQETEINQNCTIALEFRWVAQGSKWEVHKDLYGTDNPYK